MKLLTLNNLLSKHKDLYFLPLICILTVPLLIVAFDTEGSKSYIAFIISILIPILIRGVFNIKPYHFLLLTIPVLILSIIYSYSYFEFRTFVGIATWVSVFNTNVYEASELSSGIETITIVVITSQIAIYVFFLLKTKRMVIPQINLLRKRVYIFLLLVFTVDFAFSGATSAAFPLRGTYSFFGFFVEKYNEIKFFEKKKNIFFNAKRGEDFPENLQETIVIVVGESLRRDHLEYYGYQKPTTPLMKQEPIICYNNVISPANMSVASLKRVFSLAEYKNEKAYFEYPSFISAFKEVGFKTYWISTQRIYGVHDSQISYIAKEADSVIFRTPINFDQTLFEPYDKIIEESTDTKKLIFIHVLGNHRNYEKRYPSDFAYFTKEEHQDEKVNFIRKYDDAVRYNDFVMHHFLKKLKSQKGENTFIAFSDHGESLFDSYGEYRYHGAINPAKSEFIVPLITWFSDDFKNNHFDVVADVIANKDKPIILSDFFHAVPDLFGVKFDLLKKEKAFFGKDYVIKKNRKVVNSQLEILDFEKLVDPTTNRLL